MIKQAWSKVRDVETPLRVRVVLMFLLVYLASPIDLIPDFIPVLGQLDDILVTLIVVKYVRNHTTFDVKKAMA
jgi:uncharacterized membrane protein YkvA (DUF1232 family)